MSVDEDCVKEFNLMKIRHDKRYIIFVISDDGKRVTIEKIGKKQETYADFRNAVLQSDGPRYAVVDYEFKKAETGQIQGKLIFVFYCPEDSKVKQKMLYAASKETLVKPLNGIAKLIQANDASAMDEHEVQALLAKP